MKPVRDSGKGRKKKQQKTEKENNLVQSTIKHERYNVIFARTSLNLIDKDFPQGEQAALNHEPKDYKSELQ